MQMVVVILHRLRWLEKNGARLNFNKVTSVTLRKQKIAILNKNKKGEQRSEEEDRILCAANYTKHVEKAIAGDKSAKVHGKRLRCWSASKGRLFLSWNGR